MVQITVGEGGEQDLKFFLNKQGYQVSLKVWSESPSVSDLEWYLILNDIKVFLLLLLLVVTFFFFPFVPYVFI